MSFQLNTPSTLEIPLLSLFSFLHLYVVGQKAQSTSPELNYAGDTIVYHLLDINLPETGKTACQPVMLVY